MRAPVLYAVAMTAVLSVAGCAKSTTEPTASTTYTGPFTGQLVITTITASSNSASTCVSTNALSGTLKVTLDPTKSDGTVTGKAEITGTMTETAVTVSPVCTAQPASGSLGNFYPVTGTPGNLTYTGESSSTGPTPAPGVGSVTCTERRTFSGALASGAISGAMTFGRTCAGTNLVNGASTVITGNGSTIIPVTLR